MMRNTRWMAPVIVLACVAVSGWLSLRTQDSDAAGNDRAALAELIALRVTGAMTGEGFDAQGVDLAALIDRHPEVHSIGIVREDGSVVTQAGPHGAAWHAMDDPDKTFDQSVTSILVDGEPWGQTQITYVPITPAASAWWQAGPWLAATAFALVMLLRVYLWRRRSKRLGTLPRRVKTMLDTLAESVMILDTANRIVFANARFAQQTGYTCEDLVGMPCEDLRWVAQGDGGRTTDLPWTRAAQDHRTVERARIGVIGEEEQLFSYVVNCVPITDHRQRVRGVLASLGDVTGLEMKQAELEAHLTLLGEARDEILQMNDKLKQQARHDTLTGCMNRRAFLDCAAKAYATASRNGRHLGFAMIDIDHFKAINDTYGHATGDAVITGVAQTLLGLAGEDDLLCRWGGEEFCMMLATPSREACMQAAERFRTTIEQQPYCAHTVTASLGLAEIDDSITEIEELIDRADQALYASKRNGRNRTTLWSVKLAASQNADSVVERSAAAGVDELTGLPRRAQLVDALGSAIQAHQQDARNGYAVYRFDFDQFHRINQRFDYAAGDELMRAIGERFRTLADGRTLPAHLGSDEFAVLKSQVGDQRQADRIARQWVDDFSKPYTVRGEEVHLTPSIGVATSDAGYGEPEHALRDADTAGHEAKAHGGGRFVTFDARRHEAVAGRFQLEHDLKAADFDAQMALAYEPIVHAETGGVACYEASLRWRHPGLGTLEPEHFLSLVTRGTRQAELGRWAIRQACRQLRAWRDSTPAMAQVRVAVALPLVLFEAETLKTHTLQSLDASGLKPGDLTLTLLGGGLTQNKSRAYRVLEALRRAGVRLTIDITHGGPVPVESLLKCPAADFKIDADLVPDPASHPNLTDAITTLLGLGQRHDKTVIAAGIGNPRHAAQMRSLGCRYLQGPLLGEPQDAASIAMPPKRSQRRVSA